MKYRVHYTNHGYFAQDEFDTFEQAAAYGKARGFEFTIYDPLDSMVASWTVFGGLKDRRFREVMA